MTGNAVEVKNGIKSQKYASVLEHLLSMPVISATFLFCFKENEKAYLVGVPRGIRGESKSKGVFANNF